jgi:hypothetical protein
VHNNGVSYFQECLTSGGLLFQEERRALYKYLLEINRDFYTAQAHVLLKEGTVTRSIANGEATFILKNKKVNYSARMLNSPEIHSEIREIKLARVKTRNIRKLQKFFAQSDVDIIRNFPLPSRYPREESGFGISVYPFYTLTYYADGKNLLKGLVRKIRTSDKEILVKLRTL